MRRLRAEAMAETMLALTFYRELAAEAAAIPAIAGEKTASERFAGAERTFTIEAMMRDGRALQAPPRITWGTNFATRVRHQVHGSSPAFEHLLHHLLGHEQPHDRRGDHDAW